MQHFLMIMFVEHNINIMYVGIWVDPYLTRLKVYLPPRLLVIFFKNIISDFSFKVYLHVYFF